MAYHNSNGMMREVVGGDTYDYYPLGQYVVSAPEVCRGRPTFKYTRVEVEGILRLVGAGESIPEIVADYDRPEITEEAIREALSLAVDAFVSDRLPVADEAKAA